MAANIVTPFAADEVYSSSARAKCISIAEAWLGSGATSGVATWEDYHDLINPVLTAASLTTISNGDTGQQWMDRMNALNDAEQVLAGFGALAWWNADRSDLISLSGSAVTSWTDSIGGYAATQGISSARPLYSATSFNAFPGVTADGIDDELTYAASMPFPSGANPSNIRAVVQQDGLVADGLTRAAFSYGGTINDTRAVRRAVAGGVNRSNLATGTGGASVAVTGTVVDLSSRHLIRGLYGATETTLHTDDGSGTPVAGVPATSTTRTRLFSRSAATAGDFWKGVARDYFISGVETTDQTNYIDNFFMGRRAL